MKILLMGGTGALGSSLSPYLAEDHNNEIYITSRRKNKDRENIHYILCDAKNIEEIDCLLRNNRFDIVVDFMLYSKEEFDVVAKTILPLTMHYVFFSSARVYASSDEPISESSSRLLDVSDDEEYLEDFEYSLYKAAEEDILRRSQLTNWTIIRPYKTYSDNRLQLGVFEKEQWVDRAIRGKKVVFLKDSVDKITSMTHHSDAARIIGSIIYQGKMDGKIYQIANPEQKTWRDIIKIYASVFSLNGIDFEMVLTDDYCGIAELFHNKYRMKYDGFVNRIFSDNTIQENFGPFHWITAEKGLTECLDAYIKTCHKEHLQIDYSIEGYFDRLTGEREAIIKIPGIKKKIKYFLYRYFPQKILFVLRRRLSI